jgi:hypothetical protein
MSVRASPPLRAYRLRRLDEGSCWVRPKTVLSLADRSPHCKHVPESDEAALPVVPG